jgi:peptidoglycan/LPS O-acetylase OafA/YrhL
MPLVYGSQLFPEPSFIALKLPLFLIGMALAMANHRFSKEPALAALLLLFAVLLATQSSGYIVGLALVLVFSSRWVHGVGRFARAISEVLSGVLGCTVARFLADTSYAVYLFHGFFIQLFGGWLYAQPWAEHLGHRLTMLILVVLIGSYALGWFLHRFVERPGIRLGRLVVKRFLSRRHPQVAGSISLASP